MDKNETWVDIKGFENRYRVSDKGRVYSVKTNTYLSLKRLTKDGYNRIAMRKNGVQKDYRLHRLVAEIFIPNPDNKPTVNHIDGNKLNNSVENLEWATREENVQHSYDLGLKRMHRGSEHASSKLTDEQVSEIKAKYQRYKKGFGSVALAKEYGVESSTILRIIQGKRYAKDV